MRPPPLLIALLVAALGGCHTVGQPHAITAGGDFPLYVKNNSTQAAAIQISILEQHGETTVFDNEFQLQPGQEAAIERVRLPHADYALRAKTSTLQREANVDFTSDSEWFRFVVYDDVIAFQTKG